MQQKADEEKNKQRDRIGNRKHTMLEVIPNLII